MSPSGSGARLSAFLRTFLIQGSWNYHNMLGSGFAFAILPALRRLHRGDPEALTASIHRHMEHFNAHPYLAPLALGAAIRMEEEGEGDEAVRRFKLAVRGPLGSLGDSLVWAAWLPACSLLALAMYWAGLAPPVVIVTFLVVYNAGHVLLRAWSFRAGLAEGRGVAGALQRADLGGKAAVVEDVVAAVLGIVVVFLLVDPVGGARLSLPMLAGCGVAFVAGAWIGHRAWRPAAVAVVAAVAGIAAFGVLS